MLLRTTIFLALPLSLAACASETSTKVMGYRTTGHPLAIAGAQAAPSEARAGEALRLPARKSMADKVLTAMALERVTGRKPDPSRLIESN